ncbi:TPA: hypothetical protein DIS56_03600 [Candidatus Saccharibacteria bacterium]|nr:MAG: hypothetical protein A3F05_03875 [Candidatus Saccharibacteria bacterium RIFCSPHIGHO2_12_FULL_47_17]HCM52185.1 hypothetical protein [Candidatus Saccharibacteria bacterium]
MTHLDVSFERRFFQPLSSHELMSEYSEAELFDFAENVRFEWQPAGERPVATCRPRDMRICSLIQSMEGLDPAWAPAMGLRVGPRVIWEWDRANYRGRYRQLGGIALFRPYEAAEAAFRRNLYRPNDEAQLSRLSDREVENFEAARIAASCQMTSGHLLFIAGRSGQSIKALVSPIGRDLYRLAREGVMAGPYIRQTADGPVQMSGIGLYEKIAAGESQRRQKWLVPSLQVGN